jgi:ubiquinone biosynthesis protein Coq4
MGKAFLGLLRNPTRTENIFKLSQLGISSPDQRSVLHLAEWAMRNDKFRVLYKERYLPELPTLEHLGTLARGTLGRELHQHLVKNGLKPGFFPSISIRSPIEYLSMRVRQTHDIWHVLCGYDTSVRGELALQAFDLGQMPSGLSALLLAGGILHTAKGSPESVQPLMHAVAEGYLRGTRAEVLLGERWEERLGEPLESLRVEMKLITAEAT